MKQFITLILITILMGFVNACGQTIPDSIYYSWWENKGKSIFKGVEGEIFSGVTMGYLQVLNTSDTLMLDFHATETTLKIDEPEDDVFDDVHKNYSTYSTDGKSLLEYQTFVLANILSIELGGTNYSIGAFDGANDMPIAGLLFYYCSDDNIEYLSLYVTEPLLLSTAHQFPKNQGNEYESYKPVKAITVLPGSNIIFKMKK